MIAAFSPEAYLYCCMLNCCYSPPTYHPLLFFNRTTTAGFPVISHNAFVYYSVVLLYLYDPFWQKGFVPSSRLALQRKQSTPVRM